MKKIVKLTAIVAVLTSTVSVAYAEQDPSIQEVEQGVFVREATEQQIDAYYEKLGEKRPAAVDTSEKGKIIKGFQKVKEEKSKDMFGKEHVYTYYKVDYQDTPEAEKVKKKIKEEKEKQNKGTKVDLGGISPNYIPNEEGDVRIHRVYEKLTDGTKFDYSTKNYWSNFTASYYRKVLDLVSGYAVSNPIAGYFTGLVFDDLQKSLSAKGDAFSYYRLVFQYGQVYHNGAFRSYYETYQREWYWKHEQISYNANNTIKSAATAYYLPDGVGYMPFDWIYTGDFYNDSAIISVAQTQYRSNPNLLAPVRDFYRNEGYRADWKKIGAVAY